MTRIKHRYARSEYIIYIIKIIKVLAGNFLKFVIVSQRGVIFGHTRK